MSKKITLSKETVRSLTARPMSHEEVTMVGGGSDTSGLDCGLSSPCGGATIWATCGCNSAECAGSTGCDTSGCPER
ncbi:MAG: hypothetical protein WD397_05755 [Wenzhouxiangellaceae bacterium]